MMNSVRFFREKQKTNIHIDLSDMVESVSSTYVKEGISWYANVLTEFSLNLDGISFLKHSDLISILKTYINMSACTAFRTDAFETEMISHKQQIQLLSNITDMIDQKKWANV